LFATGILGLAAIGWRKRGTHPDGRDLGGKSPILRIVAAKQAIAAVIEPVAQHGEPAMAAKEIEIFVAGCYVCAEAVEMVKRVAGSSYRVEVLDMRLPDVAARARQLGIHNVPSIVIRGKLAPWCAGRKPDEATLWNAIHAGTVRRPTTAKAEAAEERGPRADLRYRLRLRGLKWTNLDTKLANIIVTENVSFSQLTRMSDEALLGFRHFGQGCLLRLRAIQSTKRVYKGSRRAHGDRG
jgi:hypothetical protein